MDSQGAALAVGGTGKTTILTEPTDTLACRVGGLAEVVRFERFYGEKRSVKAMASPRQGSSPGSERGLDARRFEETPGEHPNGLSGGWLGGLNGGGFEYQMCSVEV
jgi:hypothetical protein